MSVRFIPPQCGQNHDHFFSFRNQNYSQWQIKQSVPISKFKTMPKTTNSIGVTLKPQFVDRDWTALKVSSVSSVTFGIVLGYVPVDL